MKKVLLFMLTIGLMACNSNVSEGDCKCNDKTLAVPFTSHSHSVVCGNVDKFLYKGEISSFNLSLASFMFKKTDTLKKEKQEVLIHNYAR